MAGLNRVFADASEPEDYKGRRALKTCLFGVSSHPLMWLLREGARPSGCGALLLFISVKMCAGHAIGLHICLQDCIFAHYITVYHTC